MAKRFFLIKRKSSPIYYARVLNQETGLYLTRSTGEADRDEALVVAASWFKYGIPDGKRREGRPIGAVTNTDTIVRGIRSAYSITGADARRIIDALVDRGFKARIDEAPIVGPATKPLVEYLSSFWNFDESGYVKEKIAYGQHIGRRHCADQILRLPHWRRFFGDELLLSELTRERLKSFQLYLREHVAPKTANLIISAGSVALAWLAERGDLPENPAQALRKFGGEPKKRGVLTENEARDVLAVQWPDERSRLASRIAAATGLRANEICALTIADIGEDRLYIRHSWSPSDKLKAPKNGEEREAPLQAGLRDELLALHATNPHKSGPKFIFYSTDPEKPIHNEVLRREFIAALIRLRVGSLPKKAGEKARLEYNRQVDAVREELRERGICFHSWRHWYAAAMADRLDIRTVQIGTGHKTQAMAEEYAKHRQEQHFQKLAVASEDAAGRILSFPQKQASGNA